MKPRALTAPAVVLVASLSASPVNAAKSWKPRFQPRPGSIQHFVVSNELALSANVPLLGRMGGHLNLRIELRQEVAERLRDGPTTLELTYDRIELDGEFGERVIDYDSAQPPHGGEERGREYLDRLIGQSLTLVVSPRGEIIEVRGPADAPAIGGADPLLETLTDGLETKLVRALYQQASPIFPERRLRSGDTWNAEFSIPDPAFGTMRVDSEYEMLGRGKLDRHKYVKTGVRNRVELDGRGPLLDHVGSLVGAKGEVRVRTEQAEGSGTIWTERKTGVILGLLGEQQLVLRLSVPMKVLGFTKRIEVPVDVEQKIAVERVE